MTKTNGQHDHPRLFAIVDYDFSPQPIDLYYMRTTFKPIYFQSEKTKKSLYWNFIQIVVPSMWTCVSIMEIEPNAYLCYYPHGKCTASMYALFIYNITHAHLNHIDTRMNISNCTNPQLTAGWLKLTQCNNPCPTTHHFYKKCAHVCTFLPENGALRDICLIHCGICEMGLLCGYAWYFGHDTHVTSLKWSKIVSTNCTILVSGNWIILKINICSAQSTI